MEPLKIGDTVWVNYVEGSFKSGKAWLDEVKSFTPTGYIKLKNASHGKYRPKDGKEAGQDGSAWQYQIEGRATPEGVADFYQRRELHNEWRRIDLAFETYLKMTDFERTNIRHFIQKAEQRPAVEPIK